MNKSTAMKWLNVCALVAMVMVNALANLLPIGGNTTGEVSTNYPTLFTPAPVTFAIWGVIYVLMAVFVVHQLNLSRKSTAGTDLRSDVGPWFIVSCALNIGWIFAWHFQQMGLALILIAALLICLIWINGNVELRTEKSILGKISIAGFQVYLGWIVAATVANIAVFLVQIGWDRFEFSEEFWVLVALIVAMGIGAAFSVDRRRPFATIAVMWAFAGILLRHVSADGFQMAYPFVIVVAIAGLVLMVASILTRGLKGTAFKRIEYSGMRGSESKPLA